VVDGSGASLYWMSPAMLVATSLASLSLNGTSAVDDGDCQNAIFGSFPMATGAANIANTHYCQELSYEYIS